MFLVDDAVELLPHENVIVAAKYYGHAVVDQHPMDGVTPPQAPAVESVNATRVLATPFKRAETAQDVSDGLDSAAAVYGNPADQLVNEDELEACLARRQYVEPIILGVAKGPVPVVAAA